MEMNREVDSNDISECSHDDKPSVGMFVVFPMLHSLQSFRTMLDSCCIGIISDKCVNFHLQNFK